MLMNKDIYLNIAGFNGLLKFHKAQNNFWRDLLINEIKTAYKGFISRVTPRNIDFIFNFYEQPVVALERNSKTIKRNFIYTFGEKRPNKIITFYHISLNQFMLILVQILQMLIKENNGFFIHSSASKINGTSVLFTGRSGAGKSTIVNFLNQQYPALADDTVIIRQKNGRYLCFQTPLIEKNSRIKKESKGYRIDRIYFLQKATYFKRHKITDKNWIISNLSSQLWTGKDVLKKQMDYLLKFINDFDEFYLLYFAKQKENMIKFFQRFDEKISAEKGHIVKKNRRKYNYF